METHPLLKGTPLWNLCRQGMEFFLPHLYWIPGNGKKIILWTYSILDCPPLNNISKLDGIQEWDLDENLNTLFDISSWKTDGIWENWNIPEVRPILLDAKTSLLFHLPGCAPVHISLPNKRGWGKIGEYTTTPGFNILQTCKDPSSQ